MKQENRCTYQIRVLSGFSQIPKICWILVCTVLALNMYGNPEVCEFRDSKIPKQILLFEKNKGQFDKSILFKALDKQAHYEFLKNSIDVSLANKQNKVEFAYKMKFISANENVNLRGNKNTVNPQFGSRNYITKDGMISNVGYFKEIKYESLWNNIDALFHNSGEGMKYDFIVSPGGKPKDIKIALDGVKNLVVNKKGELSFVSSLGKLLKGAPHTYQIINGKKIIIKSAYSIDNEILSFNIGNYDTDYPLIIDPIALKYATVLGSGDQDFEITISTLNKAGDKLYYVASRDSLVTDKAEEVLNIGCMNANGSAILWTTTIYGIGDKNDLAYNEGLGISVNDAGDVFVAFESDYGTTEGVNKVAQILGPHPTYPASPGVGEIGDDGTKLIRLNPDGSILKYFTYLGGTDEHWSESNTKFVVKGDKVYIGLNLGDFSDNYLSIIPPTTGAVNTITNSSGRATYGSSIVCYNTAVSGANSIEKAAYLGGLEISQIIEDKDGNFFIAGLGFKNLSNTYQPEWSANTISKIEDVEDNQSYPFLLKLDPTLSTILYRSPITVILPERDPNLTIYDLSIDIDIDMNLFLFYNQKYFNNSGATNRRNIDISTIITPALKTNFIQSLPSWNFDLILNIGYKVPLNNLSKPAWSAIFPSLSTYRSNLKFGVDGKGKSHIIYMSNYTPIITNGAIQDNKVLPSGDYIQYLTLSQSGTIDYGSVLGSSYSEFIISSGSFRDTYEYIGSIAVDNLKNTVYTFINYGASQTRIVTPSYWDNQTMAQINVVGTDNGKKLTRSTQTSLMVFNEANYTNTITDFPGGANTFCVGGQIYQDPNSGPINGNEPQFISGNGSLATHNIPDLYRAGIRFPHPIPKSPKIVFQWQRSEDGGTTWGNIVGENKSVFKPEPASSAGTVKFRRLGISGDTIISNTATAIIAGNFNLQINGPTDPTYYCAGLPSQSLGVTVTGASGNITWQWYDGFTPVGNTIINPASGSGNQSTFTASVGSSVTKSGFYRLVIIDAGGCRKEYFATIQPITAKAFATATAPVCPGGTGTIRLGPVSVNPLFDYRWAGPSSFTSSLPNPVSSIGGKYYLEVKLKSQSSFCAGGKDSVDVIAFTAHDVALVNTLTEKGYCQDDPIDSIGLNNPAPASGYAYHWAPSNSLSDNSSYRTTFNPQLPPFKVAPLDSLFYIFNATRLSDGCVFSDTLLVRDTILAVADASDISYNIESSSGCAAGTYLLKGGSKMEASFFEWTPTATTYPGGLSALMGSTTFGIDKLGSSKGSKKQALIYYPQGNYDITFTLKAAYFPIGNTNCFHIDNMVLRISCGAGGTSPCGIIGADNKGLNGACSQKGVVLTAPSASIGTWNSVVWTTKKVDNVLQPANTVPKGLYTVNGTSLASITGNHPENVTVKIEDGTWGWSSADSVIYQFTATSIIAGITTTCTQEIKIYAANSFAPKARLKDTLACYFPTVTNGTRKYSTNGKAELPLTLTNANYAIAPVGNIEYNWNILYGGGVNTGLLNNKFPTLSPTQSAKFKLTMRDSSSGCISLDTLALSVVKVEAKAGDDQLTGCQGSIVKLGTDSLINHKYKWTPSAGLFYPLSGGTPNDSVAEPFTTVPSGTTSFDLIVTEITTGCQAKDSVVITADGTAPTALTNVTFTSCKDKKFNMGPGTGYVVPSGASIVWTATGGSANLSWLSSTTVLNPEVQMPAVFSAQAIFTLTISKGSCGTTSATYTIVPVSTISAGVDVTSSCSSTLVKIGLSANNPAFSYKWFPQQGLYTDNTGTIRLNNAVNSSFEMYAKPSEETEYTLLATHTTSGCIVSDVVKVSTPSGLTLSLNDDITYCPGSGSVQLIGTGTGSNPTWTAIGYNANVTGNPFPISSADATRALSYLSSSSAMSTNFNQAIPSPGIYIYRLTLDGTGGCTISDDIKVTVYNFTTGLAGGDLDVCEGTPTQLGAKNIPSSYNFNWSVVSPSSSVNSILNKTDKNPTVLPLLKTIYEVTYIDALSGCSTTEKVIVTPIPNLTINTLATSTACGEIVGLNVTSLVQRLDTVQNPVWYKDFIPSLQVSPPSTFSTNKNTTFYVVGRNQFGCIDTGSIQLNVEPVKKPVVVDTVILAPKVSTINLNDYLPLATSVSTGTLSWYTSNTGASGTQVTNPIQSSGTYYCIEKTTSGCVSAAAKLSVVPPNPILNAEFSCNTTCSNFEVGLNFTIKNNDYFNTSSGLSFSVNLPSGLTVGTSTTSTTCGGTITAVAGATAITFTGGSAAAGAECLVNIPILGTAGGPYAISSAHVSTVAGLDNGITVAPTVTVTATCAGQGPGKPLNLVVKQDGNMSWTAPLLIGSSPVLDYLIEYSTDGGTSWQTFNDGISNVAATYFNIVNPTMTYQFRITALNSFGSGCSALLSSSYNNLNNCEGPFACLGTINVKLNGDCSRTVSVKELLLPCGPIDYTVKVNDINPTNGGIVDGISPVGGWLYGIFDQNGALVCQGRIVSTDGSGPVMSPNQLSAWNAIDTIVTWADNVDEIYNVPSSWWGNNVGYSSIPVFGSKYYTGRPYLVDSCELVGGVNPSSDTWIIDADDDGKESVNDKWNVHLSRNLQIKVTDYMESPQCNGNGYQYVLRRTFQIIDQRGNSTFLNQIIYFQRPAARGSFANRFDGIATPGANPQTPLDRGPGNLGQFGPFGSGPRKVHSSYGEADNKDLNKANMGAFSYATTLGADQMTTPYGMGGQSLRDTIVYDISNGNCYDFNAASEMKKLLTGLYVAVDTLPSGAKDSVSLFSEQLNSQFSASFSYKEFPACNNGKNYEVVTTVFDWCTGAQSFDTLIIQMVDKSAPVFAAERAALPILGSSSSNPILVSVGTNDCTGSLRLGTASNLRDLSTLFNLKVRDNCSAQTAINLNYAFETKDYWNQLYYLPQGSYTASTYTIVNTGNVPTVIGLPIGQHKVIITATDGCNNQSTQVLYFDVIDNVAPVMKCDDALTVSLTSNSSSNYYIDANKSDADLAKQMQARLYVADINEGSRDNCTLDSLYVRRQFHKDCLPYFALNLEYDIYGNTPDGKVELNDFDRVGTTDLYYTPKFMQYVDFFCCDPSTVMVELWGSDARHYNNASAGNWNYCWTNITIEDKSVPVITAPVLTKTYNSSNQYKGVARPVTNWVNCTDKEIIGTSSNTDGEIANEAASNLLFGYPDIYGLECKVSVAYSVTKKLTCDTGTITRRWVVTKGIGDGKIITVRDSQLIHVRANHNFSITVPVDQSATCSVKNGTDLILDEDGCDLLAVSYSETKYDAAPGDNFCYKIYRTATVINWCMLPNYFSCAAADPGAYAVTIPRNTGSAAVKYTFTLGSANTGRSQTALDASTAGSNVLVKGGAIAAAGENIAGSGASSTSGFVTPTLPSCVTKPGFAYKYTQVIKVTDNVKPVVASGTTWTPATSATDVAAGIIWNATKNSFSIAGKLSTPNCLAKVKLSFAASDACATNDLELEKTELLRRGTDVAGTGTVLTGTAASTTNGLFTVELSGVPVGEYDLRVTVRDDCGNVTVSRLAVDVEDNKAPAPVCVQILTATLMPDGVGGCMVVVRATDVFQDINRDWITEECSGPVKATMAKLTNGVEGAKAETLTLTSADKGIVTARVYLTDAAGNSDFCTVTINVEDNFCGNGTASAAVTGAIQTESKVTVEGVQVNLSGQTQKSFATGVNGLFVFNNLTAGADYTVTPGLNKGFLNGVSTYDLILISKHMLSVQPLNTPYKLIAADVNNSKSVTTLDLIQLRKLILNIDASFANNTSWRFVDASYTFPNASNPWAASFPEVKNVNDLVGSLSANFVAIKVGDVNGNAIANSTQGSVRNLTSNLGINVADMNLVAGNEYKVDFTAADLNGIEGFQFTLNLDKKGLELVDLVAGIAVEENFGIFTEEGVITASWNGEAKGGVLFSLVVRAKSNTTLSEVLNLNSRYTAAEAYKGGEVMCVGLNFNASKASANYELYQNTPNPFAGESIIGFNLPVAGAATLTIQDVTGRTLKVIKGQYAKGYNQVSLKSTELTATGVLTYTLKAADFTMTKKMMVVE